MVTVLFFEAHMLATGASAFLAHMYKWEDAGMNQAVAAVVCKRVFSNVVISYFCKGYKSK